MAIFLNLITFNLTDDVNTPEYNINTDYVLYQDRDAITKQIITHFTIPPCEKKYLKRVLAYPFVAEMTQAEKDIEDQKIQQALEDLKDFTLQFNKLTKAFALVTMDELNNIRQWIMSFKSAVSLATSLADLKTRVGNLSNMNDRTIQQLRTAVKTKYDTLQ